MNSSAPSLNSTTWLDAKTAGMAHTSIIVWTLVASLTSLFGNTAVLVSSIKYNAIHLDRVSVVVIQNLAVADLCYSIYSMLTLGYLTEGMQVYGAVPCYVISMLSYLFVSVDTTLVCVLNISKLTILMFPLQTRTRSFRCGRILVGCVWALCGICVVSLILLSSVPVKLQVLFRAGINKCGSALPPPARMLMMVFAMMFTLLPSLLIFLTTIWLLCYVRRVRGLQRQGVITLLLISTLFCFANAPSGSYYFFKGALTNEDKASDWFQIYFSFSMYVLYINYACNPIIYLFTIRSYRRFIRMKVLSVVVPFRRASRHMLSFSFNNITPPVVASFSLNNITPPVANNP